MALEKMMWRGFDLKDEESILSQGLKEQVVASDITTVLREATRIYLVGDLARPQSFPFPRPSR